MLHPFSTIWHALSLHSLTSLSLHSLTHSLPYYFHFLILISHISSSLFIKLSTRFLYSTVNFLLIYSYYFSRYPDLFSLELFAVKFFMLRSSYNFCLYTLPKFYWSARTFLMVKRVTFLHLSNRYTWLLSMGIENIWEISKWTTL